MATEKGCNSLDKQAALAQIFPYYARFFDLRQNVVLNGQTAPGFGEFIATSGQYFLSKKAKLYEANTFEKLLLYPETQVSAALLRQRFDGLVAAAPQLVQPGPEHYCTYLTAVVIAAGFSQDPQLLAQLQGQLKRLTYTKNYKLSYHGFAKARLLLVDLAAAKVYASPAGREVAPGLEQYLAGLHKKSFQRDAEVD